MATLRGQDEILANLRNVIAATTAKAAVAAYGKGEQIMQEAKGETPVLSGAMRASGYVTLPDVTPTRVDVELGFGGPAQEYTVIQHENMTFHHNVGKAKFLEDPMKAAAGEFLPDMAARIVAASTNPPVKGAMPDTPHNAEAKLLYESYYGVPAPGATP